MKLGEITITRLAMQRLAGSRYMLGFAVSKSSLMMMVATACGAAVTSDILLFTIMITGIINGNDCLNATANRTFDTIGMSSTGDIHRQKRNNHYE